MVIKNMCVYLQSWDLWLERMDRRDLLRLFIFYSYPFLLVAAPISSSRFACKSKRSSLKEMYSLSLAEMWSAYFNIPSSASTLVSRGMMPHGLEKKMLIQMKHLSTWRGLLKTLASQCGSAKVCVLGLMHVPSIVPLPFSLQLYGD